MHATTFSSRRDLRNWVDNATSDWLNRSDSDVDTITEAIADMDHPLYGDDWTDFLGSLPSLMELADQD